MGGFGGAGGKFISGNVAFSGGIGFSTFISGTGGGGGGILVCENAFVKNSSSKHAKKIFDRIIIKIFD